MQRVPGQGGARREAKVHGSLTGAFAIEKLIPSYFSWLEAKMAKMARVKSLCK